MNFEELRDYCIHKKAVEETFPFDDVTMVFKVMGKMFALTRLDEEHCKVNLKCDPDRSIELREAYEDIQPGFHMNKKHWNTINCEGELDPSFLKELIDHSYDLVVAGLSKKDREVLAAL